MLILAVTPLAFIAAINPSLNAATVTAVIVLLVPTMGHLDPLGSAIDRVFEVAVGALTGLAVSFIVLPSRAHVQMRSAAGRLLELIAAALAELLAGLSRGRDNDALHLIQDGIGAALTELNATGAEAERERAARLSSGADTGPLLRTILRLRHDVVMIGRASFGRPWIFKEVKHYLETGEEMPPLSSEWKLNVLQQEVEDSVKLLDERRGILHVRRHLAASPLFKGIPNFRDTRIAMLRAETKEELYRIFNEIAKLNIT